MERAQSFAVLEEDIVVNIITADSLEHAEEFSGKKCVELTDEVLEKRQAVLGAKYDGVFFKGPQEYPSWIWDDSSGSWIPPVPLPSDHEKIENGMITIYQWFESTQEWISHTQPVIVHY